MLVFLCVIYILVGNVAIIKSEAAKGLAKGALDIVDALKAEIDSMQSSSASGVAGATSTPLIPSVVSSAGTGSATVVGAATAGVMGGSGGLVGGAGVAVTLETTSVPESVLPFNMSKNFWVQWGLLLFVGAQMLSSIGGLLFRPASKPPTAVLSDSGVVPHQGEWCGGLEGVMWKTDWAKELAGVQRGLGGPYHERVMLEFLKSQYAGPHPTSLGLKLSSSSSTTNHNPNNQTTDSNNVAMKHPKRIQSTSEGFALDSLYRSPKSKLLHARLSEIQDTLESARWEAVRVLKYLEEVEKSALWTGYWNWVGENIQVSKVPTKAHPVKKPHPEEGRRKESENVKQKITQVQPQRVICRGAIGDALGGCEGVQKLMEEVDGLWTQT
jgi:hypothetical protein